jgi:hypothetical protein
MKLVSIPANPVPDDAVTGTLKTPDGVALRFVRFAPPVGTQGNRSSIYQCTEDAEQGSMAS